MAKNKYYVFWIAIILVLVFALQTFVANFTSLFVLNESSWTEPWRFITSIFLHGSAKHLISNLFALLFFGFILEKTIGSHKFIGVFFLTGILANLIATNFYLSSLGASGAIMGIIGTLTILRPTITVYSFGMIMPMFLASIIWVVVDAIGIFIPSNIGHIAHLSGVLFGVIIGLVLRREYKINQKRHKVNVPEHLIRRWETLYMNH